MKNKIEKDPHSYAEPEKVKISHLDIELTPDFATKTISGVVEMSLDWLDKESNTLILDTKELTIEQIEVLNSDGSWSITTSKLDEKDEFLGSALHIDANANHAKVRIKYQTSPEAAGLQWLEPSQTATKSHPYLYSHAQPVNTRSWLPSQDTPGVRQSYTTRINTPKALRAVMGGANNPEEALNGSFEFSMNEAIPSYLIAFAVGNIAPQKIGPRSYAYSEPGVVEKAAAEFEDAETMLQAAEAMFGKFRWKRCDILAMPPSFPMGGMENPVIFATPTIIAGDKSLVSVIAHEIGHFYAGNLVTNSNWNHIWLNEGFTSYVQYRIVERVYGEELAKQELFVTIDRLLNNDLKDLPAADQHLEVDFTGRDPHDAFGDVAYYKGAWFLLTLEQKFGREIFTEFLKNYFEHFAFQSISTAIFEEYLKTNLIDKYPNICTMEEVAQWIHQPGVPEDKAAIDPKRFPINDKIRQQWLNKEISGADLQAKAWSSPEWVYFLTKILPENPTHEQLKDLDNCYKLTGRSNAEDASAWYKVAIKANYSEANAELSNYLINIGRRKLVSPLYSELLKTKEGLKFAEEVYTIARPNYNALTRDTVDKMIEKAKKVFSDEQSQQAVETTMDNRYRKFQPAQTVEAVSSAQLELDTQMNTM